jgi:uncharacterized surface protein with fasciclin (FAS1) repeats
MTTLLKVVLVTGLCAGAGACSSSSMPAAPSAALSLAGRDVQGTARSGGPSIVDLVLAEDGEFDVLQAAVIRAGLVEVLSGNGQYTVFAPTDAAFVSTLGVADEAAAIAAVETLAAGELKNILLYHVTHGRRASKSVLAAPAYSMLNGATLTRETLQSAQFAAVDIEASNGIVHAINAVLMP